VRVDQQFQSGLSKDERPAIGIEERSYDYSYSLMESFSLRYQTPLREEVSSFDVAETVYKSELAFSRKRSVAIVVKC
jgi:hypothetical protein